MPCRNLFFPAVLLAVLVLPGEAFASGKCFPTEGGEIECLIEEISDCEAIHDWPYAQNLFCPAAFSAAQRMVSLLAETLRVKGPTRSSFYYYQTLPDSQAPAGERKQTTTPCLDTPAPFDRVGRSPVVGAGTPLCNLVAYVTSPGPTGPGSAVRPGDPIPAQLRKYPDYFANLYSQRQGIGFRKFRTGSDFDPLVSGLGAAAYDGFIADYPQFNTMSLYAPGTWAYDRRYHGVSGGGGGGWGGEISFVSERDDRSALLTFGGGGGGGMTSYRYRPFSVNRYSRLGAGGGGGMQFGDSYSFRGQNYNGLGLGAGFGLTSTGDSDPAVQYSYNDYVGSDHPVRPPHEFNQRVIREYRKQLRKLKRQLRKRFRNREQILFTGGGGMGAGTAYLMSSEEEFEPHALSTQAGFQFRYEFSQLEAPAERGFQEDPNNLGEVQTDFYENLGNYYLVANEEAFKACGSDYSNFDCMCPKMHAIVICLAKQQNPGETLPSWLFQQHCPVSSESTQQAENGFSHYQQLLYDGSIDVTIPASSDPENPDPQSCREILEDHFTDLNSPIDVP